MFEPYNAESLAGSWPHSSVAHVWRGPPNCQLVQATPPCCVQAFRYIIAYLRSVATSGDSTQVTPLLPSRTDDLEVLKQEARFYRLPDLESSVSAALANATESSAAINPSAAVTGSIPATAANGVVDDTTDIWNKASRMHLEFQSVYVTVSSPNGLKFTEQERLNAMAEVNERTASLQSAGFRIKAMNSGVAHDRRSKDYFMCALILCSMFAMVCSSLLWAGSACPAHAQ